MPEANYEELNLAGNNNIVLTWKKTWVVSTRKYTTNCMPLNKLYPTNNWYILLLEYDITSILPIFEWK